MGHFLIPATKEAPQKSANDDLDTLGAIPDAVPVVLTEAPIEEQLAINTLWPESHKLYGHGNELFSLCCDHEGKLVASSCKVLNFSGTVHAILVLKIFLIVLNFITFNPIHLQRK